MGGIIALAMVLGMLAPSGITALAEDQTNDGAEGIVAIHIDGKSKGWDIQKVDYDFGGFDTHGYQQAADLGIYPQDVYCVLPTGNPGADANKNQHFRWRWNLGANTYIYNNNREMLANKEWAPEASNLSDLEGLAAIIYYGQKNGYEYGDIQNAVYWWITSGKEGAPDFSGQQYQNDITKAYKDGTAKAPASYGFYMYVPDNKVTEMVQNTIGLAIWSEESKPEISNTTAKVNDTKKEVTLASGDEGTMTDEVTFANLEDGKEYTVISTLQKDGADFDTVTSTVKGPETSLTVTFTKKITEAGEYKVKTELKDGDNVVAKHNENFDVDTETVKVTIEEPTTTTKSEETTTTKSDETTTTKSDETTTTKSDETTTTKSSDDSTEGKISTTVSAEGKKASADKAARLTFEETKAVVMVEDAIDYEGLVKGATYTVSGTLVEIDKDGNIIDDSVATATDELVAEEASGTWNLEFGGVDLKPYKKYVVFEEAYTAGGEDKNATVDKPLEHKDVTDKAQTILTEDENGRVLDDSEDPTTTIAKSKNTKSSKAPKTGDESSPALWIVLILAAAIAASVVIYRRKRTEQ